MMTEKVVGGYCEEFVVQRGSHVICINYDDVHDIASVVFVCQIEDAGRFLMNRTSMHPEAVANIVLALGESVDGQKCMVRLCSELDKAYIRFVEYGETDNDWDVFKKIRDEIKTKLTELGYNKSQLKRVRVEGLLEDMAGKEEIDGVVSETARDNWVSICFNTNNIALAAVGINNGEKLLEYIKEIFVDGVGLKDAVITDCIGKFFDEGIDG